MTEVQRIREQFQRAFNGEAWHGPSVLKILDGVTAQQAAAHPIPGAHSIWELTLHIAAWENACRRRLEVGLDTIIYKIRNKLIIT